MIGAFVGAISVVLVLGGALCLYEYTLYTPEQRASAPRLSYAFLGASVLLLLVGFAGLASAVIGSGEEWLRSVVVIAGALPALLQYRMHRKMGIDRSPLTERVTETWL